MRWLVLRMLVCLEIELVGLILIGSVISGTVTKGWEMNASLVQAIVNFIKRIWTEGINYTWVTISIVFSSFCDNLRLDSQIYSKKREKNKYETKLFYTHFKVRKSLIVWTHWKSLSYTINGITWIGVFMNVVSLVHCFGVKPKTEIWYQLKPFNYT